MQAIIEAGTASVEWVSEEFAGADLSDKRLDRRLIKTAEQLAKSPGLADQRSVWGLGEYAGGVSAV